MPELHDVRRDAEKQLAVIATLYEADLALQRTSPTLRGQISRFLANQRAALDQLAAGVAAPGTAEAHTHYPFARDEDAFAASLAKNMPGLGEGRPDVVAAIARHQPFSVPALGRLGDLLTDESQQRLSPETRQRPKDAEPAESTSPVDLASDPVTEPPPVPKANAGGGVLSGGHFINGVPYDPVTLQRQQEEARQRESTEVYVAWRFAGSEVTALDTLEAIDAAVQAAVAEVSAVAGLDPQAR